MSVLAWSTLTFLNSFTFFSAYFCSCSIFSLRWLFCCSRLILACSISCFDFCNLDFISAIDWILSLSNFSSLDLNSFYDYALDYINDFLLISSSNLDYCNCCFFVKNARSDCAMLCLIYSVLFLVSLILLRARFSSSCSMRTLFVSLNTSFCILVLMLRIWV